VGFEPTVRFPVRSLSRRVLSTAQSPLRGCCNFNPSKGSVSRQTVVVKADRTAIARFDPVSGCRARSRGKRKVTRGTRKPKDCKEFVEFETPSFQRLPVKKAGKAVADLAAGGEKGLQEGSAFVGEDAGNNLHPVVEAGVGQDFETRTDCAAFGVVCSINETGDPGLNDRASAHAARLDGGKESGAGQAVVAELAGSFPDHDDFGVGGGVAISNGAIA
jgi:hypothetical protein